MYMMTPVEISKVLSRKFNKGRDLSDIRNRASVRLQENRRSKRSAVLNQFRQVVDIPEAVKKTAAEERIDRLKAYKKEKLKKMEEFKRTQKPRFCSSVKVRHTGGTPYRNTESRMKSKQVIMDPVLHLPAITRARTAANKQFVFKATLDTKPVNLRTAVTKVIEREAIEKPVAPKEKPKKKEIPTVSSSNSKNVPSGSRVTKTQPDKQATKENRSRNGLTDVGKKNRPVLSNKIPEKNQPVKPVVKKAIKDDEKENNSVDSSKNNMKTNENAGDKFRDVTNRLIQTRSNSNKSEPKGNKIIEEKSGRVTRSTRQQPNSIKSCVKETAKKDIQLENGSAETTNLIINDVIVNTIDETHSRGISFQRERLQSEINRLNSAADTWSRKGETEIPDHIKDEILAVVGQTKLLISGRFKKFKGLIDRCDSNQEKESLKVTLEDLEGYWEVMYQQVEQLDKKYRNLVELENNNWEERTLQPKQVLQKAAPKKKTVRPVTSKFKEFLRSKKNEDSATVQKPATPRGNVRPVEDIAESSLYMSASKGEDEMELEGNNQGYPKTPRSTPAIRRILNNSRRKSSIALLTLQQTHLMKLASSPKITDF